MTLHPRIVRLTPPRFSPDNIKEKVVCIRAHRERLFRVEFEQVGSKQIFHNYGHGGAGWTFLFGCVHESIRQCEQHCSNNLDAHASIAVIGAGCYGLLTAIMLARAGHTVRIIAREINDINSYKAAGFFFPRPRKMSTPEECTIFHARGIESYRTYVQIIAGNHPFITCGPKLVPAYYGLDIDPGFGPYIEQKLIKQPEHVRIDFGNGKQHDVQHYDVLFINAPIMMAELHREISTLGIPIAQETITNFAELPESIIFNCAGMGAKDLAHDARVIPVQGHLITLKNQPPHEQLQYMINVKVTMTNPNGTQRDELIYYAPKDEGIAGITFIRGQDSLTTNHHEFDRLLQRCREYFF